MSDPSEILTRRLEAVLDGSQEARGLHFFCQIGGTYHDYGMLTLQVSASGWVLLGWRLDDDQQLYSVRLMPQDQNRFYQMLLDLPFWDHAPARRPRRDDDELNIHLRLSDQTAGTWNGIQCWGEDVPQVPVIQTLLQRINRLALALSEGEIPTPSWHGDEPSTAQRS